MGYGDEGGEKKVKERITSTFASRAHLRRQDE